MKTIDNLITRLVEGDQLELEELRIIGYILKECRAIEIAERKKEIVTVQMSPDMYKWYIRNAYNEKGQLKMDLSTKFETVNFNK